MENTVLKKNIHLHNGLVSYWPLNGNSNDLIGGKDGTDINTVTYETGKINQAAVYGGINYTNINSSTSTYNFVQNTGIFSISLWYSTNVVKSQFFLGNIDDGTLKGFFFGINFNNYYIGISNTIQAQDYYQVLYQIAGAVCDGNFHHVVAVGNGDDVKIYHNGTLLGTTIRTGSLATGNSNYDLSIGEPRPGNFGFQFEGKIDELAIWNRTLSEHEVQRLYNGGRGLALLGSGSGTPPEEPPPSYDSDAQLYFDELTGTVPDPYKTAVNELVLSLKAGSNNWSKLLRLWLLAGPNEQNAWISLVNPTSTAMTPVGSPTWTQYQGYTGASGKHINTNFTASIHGGSLWVLNNASYGYYIRTNVSELGCDMGCRTPYNSSFSRYSNGFYGELNSTQYAVATNSDSRGFYAVARTTSNVINLYKNGGSLSVTNPGGTPNTTSISNDNLYLLNRNVDNASTEYPSTKQMALAFTGSGDINQAELYTSIQAFATAVGFNV